MASFPLVYFSLVAFVVFMMGVHACLPMLDRAIDWLEKAGQDNDPGPRTPSA